MRRYDHILVVLRDLELMAGQDDGHSPWLKFAQDVLDGLYKSETLLGMVEALLIKADRIRKGKSLHSMKYSTASATSLHQPQPGPMRPFGDIWWAYNG